MTPTKLMLSLVKAEVCREAVDRALFQAMTEEDWQALYRLSKHHDLAHLAGDAAIASGLLSGGELYHRFLKQTSTAGYRVLLLENVLREVQKTLNEQSVPHVPLKGSVLRYYYPEPWMRTSCDVDILVHKEDLERAKRALEEANGFRFETVGPYDEGGFTPSGMHIELHYQLFEQGSVAGAEEPLSRVWEYASPISEGSYTYALCDEMFYFYHVYHMAKHFANGGCGIRPFLDLFLMKKQNPTPDTEARNRLLSQAGLLTFAEASERLSSVWFEGAEHTDVSLQMEAYLLEGGVYGTTGNRVQVQQVKKGSRLRYIWSRIWLPYETIRFYYPILQKHPSLLFFCEVRRWFRLLFGARLKKNLAEIKYNASVSEEKIDQTKRLLQEIGLS